MSKALDRLLPPIWVAAFLGLAFTGSAVQPPDVALTVLGGIGLAWCLARDREAFAALVRDHAGLFIASAALALAILASQGLSALRGLPQSDRVPAQVAVLLCMPALARFLTNARILRACVLLFAALCLWHFVMMPVESMTGWKVAWHPSYLQVRTTWPPGYQAYGLALQTYSFIGLYLPLFYLAWGPVAWQRVTLAHAPRPGLMNVLPLLWILPAFWSQSRSGFAGALAAGLLAMVARRGRLGRRGWIALLAAAAAGVAVYVFIVAAGKSSAEWRAVYLKAYALAALDPHWIAFGRGWSREAPPTVVVPGFLPLVHSHNDLVQVLFTWGLAGFVSYVAFWAMLLRLVWRRFAAVGEHWPALALVVLAPSLLADVGIHFFEKAAFLVILAAMCMALAPRARTIAPCASSSSAAPA